ncbi:hypothetical protein H6F98_18355 [Microcoleus sp. FACHB-SPT15]|uniref:hypothetical protein n=1 Tax=Microcoleus sp. FACHB-SPT15 TaxID=2692830 RepID=UPI001783654E|nr:hypothetical protein [Microcoleus sp. FACHB-SPT15]MBD1807393.1 hypothetical protein [Microcoleus sp. FACHB-SPT15]
MQGNPTSISKPFHPRKEEAIALNRSISHPSMRSLLVSRYKKITRSLGERNRL